MLEHAAERGLPCNIIVTQPRRISALGVAERVAAERGEMPGGIVGYSIWLESGSAATALLFCTTGILMRRLEEDPELDGVTHLFVDEVHERSMESDFLLMVLRDLLGRKPSLKLVLMSATMNVNLFSRYFTLRGNPSVPTLKVAGRTFPVTPLYLEDALELTQHKIRPGADWMRKGAGGGGFDGGGRGGKGGGRGGGGGGRGGGAGAAATPPPMAALAAAGGGAAAAAAKPEAELSTAELAQRYPAARYSQSVRDAMEKLDFEAINVELVVELLKWLRTCEGPHVLAEWKAARDAGKPPKPHQQKNVAAGGGGADAVLVFLPGFKEIQAVHEAILMTQEFGREPQRSWVLPLHSMLPPDEQRKVFDRPPPGARKVVLATNIAETAITVDDCAYVIDCGRMKEKRFDGTRLGRGASCAQPHGSPPAPPATGSTRRSGWSLSTTSASHARTRSSAAAARGA